MAALLALRSFFEGMLFHGEGINLLFRSLAEVEEWRRDEGFRQGLELIARRDENGVEHDFNRLFVGPGPLLAPPYGSAYLNPQRLLMQEETLAVRRFYRRYGLAPREPGSLPDDFLPVELEFAAYLLGRAGRALERGEGGEHVRWMDAYRLFLHRHMGPWIAPFARDVVGRASTGLLKGLGLVLPAIIHREIADWGEC
ncbi:MAG: molecular chaperone TorD family protein [Thermoanaerobacteraceae bacterium]|nr:molecular chaperone TorD family protein [Thermoanaerobacteraceae bacterium]